MQHTLELAATAFTKSQLIDADTPQIALAGRSNVGKSSLINALAQRKQLAKTSATPGKTRSINYYRIDETPHYLVDLPGYGYARCSQDERNAWARLLEFYLSTTKGLRALALLLDARHTPQTLDKGLVGYAQKLDLPIIPIFTKTDKCNKKTLDTTLAAWGSALAVYQPILTSSAKRTGLDAVWQRFTSVLTD